jgi:hypothetical protein
MSFPVLIPIAIKAAMWIGGIGAAAFGVGKFTQQSEINYFNKGVCTKCGGHFKYIEGTAKKGNSGYKCDVCDNCIWITFGSDRGYTYTPSPKAKK